MSEVINEAGVPTGPMGWGIANEPESKWLDEEKRTFDRIAEVAPRTLMRGDFKEPNQELIAKVVAIQESQGIEGGFSFLALEEAIFGEELPWLKQLIGSCVASGDLATTTDRKLAEVYLLNDPEDIGGVDIDGTDSMAFFAPYNYRAGRKIAGINGYSDGSLCLPHIQGKMQYGHLPCSAEGLISNRLPEPSDTGLYKEWGASNPGDSLLTKFSGIGKTFPLIRSEKIDNADEGWTVMTEHFAPFNICSMWSFVPDYTHPTWKWSDGSSVVIYKRGRQPWAHNMQIVAMVIVGGRKFVIVRNQWDKVHNNRRWFPIPFELFGDWIPSAQCQSIGELDMSDNGPVWPQPQP